MQYTKENIQDGIMAKIEAMDITREEKLLLKMRLPKYPKEIEQNVLEWINDLPLTEVDCHGESIITTMRRWDFTEKDIPYIIDGFVAFAKRNFRASDVIWQSVTGMDGVYD